MPCWKRVCKKLPRGWIVLFNMVWLSDVLNAEIFLGFLINPSKYFVRPSACLSVQTTCERWEKLILFFLILVARGGL